MVLTFPKLWARAWVALLRIPTSWLVVTHSKKNGSYHHPSKGQQNSMWWPTPSPQPCDGLEPISATIIVDEHPRAEPADSILFVMFFLRTSHHQVAGNRKIWSGLSEVNTVAASYFFSLYELKVNFCKSLDSQMNGHNLDKTIPKSHILSI